MKPARTRAGAAALAGGSDVLRYTRPERLFGEARRLLHELPRVAPRAVWMGAASIGGSPRLAAPLAWWFGRAMERTMQRLLAACAEAGATFIDVHRPRHEDVFARDAGTDFAGDGLHPSAASARHGFDVLRHRIALDALFHRPALAAA